MKTMLRCDQSVYQIDKADEIYVPYKRVDIVEEIHRRYPKKTIMLDVSQDTYDIEEIKMLIGFCRGQLKLLVSIDEFENIPKAYRVLSYPIDSFIEMENAYNHGIREFYLGVNLFHNLDLVKKFKNTHKDVVIRLKANSAAWSLEDSFDPDYMAIGAYVLPQDIDILNDMKIIDYIDFLSIGPEQESAYYDLYMVEKYYGGKISDLIKDFNSSNLIRLIQPTKIRYSCGLRCMYSGCRLCYRNISLANPELYKNLEKPEEQDNG